MDLNVFLAGEAFSLILLLLMYLGGRRAGWGLLGLLAASISVLLALVLAVDGSLTTNFTGTANTIAAANGDFISDFNFVTMIPIATFLGEVIVTMRKMFHI